MILVLCPTKSRAQRARDMIRSFEETAGLSDTRLLLVLDLDDPRLGSYGELETSERWGLTIIGRNGGSLVRSTNAALREAFRSGADIIGHVGDDHLFRTTGWDRQITEALATPGIAYGDDLLQGEYLPTAPFISTSIVEALGWYALPTSEHLFIDDTWKALGQKLGTLRYLPDVVIEHVHPAAGKAEWDAGYREANSDERMIRDGQAFAYWLAHEADSDVERIRAAMGVSA